MTTFYTWVYQELFLDVAEDNPYCVVISVTILVFLFTYFIVFGYFGIFSNEEQIYLFTFIFITDDSFFTYVTLLLTNIWLIPLLVASQVTSTQQFCRWRCFSFYWIGKRECAKSMNGIPVTGGPAHLPSHLGRILPSLRRSSIVLLTLFNITFKCSTNDKRLSRIIPNCFCELVSGTLVLFKKQSEMVFFAYFSITCIFI